MNRTDIARAIAEDLLNNDVLDEHNFSYDTAAILEYVQNIILEHLKDYSLLSGTILCISNNRYIEQYLRVSVKCRCPFYFLCVFPIICLTSDVFMQCMFLLPVTSFI